MAGRTHDPVMMAQMVSGAGFIAALDQSGGSTPGALKAYGLSEDDFATEEAMFERIHEMRVRIITAPSFTGARVLAAILFEKTMDGTADGVPVPTALWRRGVVPLLKVDKGLEAEADGVQMMKPMPGLDAVLERAAGLGVFGTKMRSVIKGASENGIAAIVRQQFEVAEHILSHGLVPILEPEIALKSPDRGRSEEMLRDEIAKGLDKLSGSRRVMLKVTIPVEADLYAPLIGHGRVARVVALSGGYSREEACTELRHGMDEAEFDRTLATAINEIYVASTVKR